MMKRILDLLFLIHTDDGRDEDGHIRIPVSDMIKATELALYQIKDTAAKFPNIYVLDDKLMDKEFKAEANIYLFNMMDFADHFDHSEEAMMNKYPLISNSIASFMLKHLGQLMFKMDNE
jgi:hypothetical protein